MLGGEGEAEDQGRRVARWLALTRITLPGFAVEHRWPIRLDHCFMRVLLDNAVGGVWHHTIARPAIKHADAETLERAIALGEGAMREPSRLAMLNRCSLEWRRLAREGGNRV
ncbi:MAG: GCN5-related N-acetyltransferase [Alphaproteobacteria bacterium]|nr:MAG: GCN5-related N-acetyltransferase [Alphaproteobacteria bacterium]